MSQEEIQEVAEATSPNRAAPLKAFESQYLDALDKTAQSNSLTKFTPAYDSTIAGCNSCHRVSSSDEFPSYKFVKITRPTAPDFNNVDWAGQK